MLKKAKKRYYSTKFDNLRNEPKGTWATINTLLNKNKKKHYQHISLIKIKRLKRNKTLQMNLMLISYHVLLF